MTKNTIRVIALLVVGVILEPTITECAAWLSAAGRHACCAKRGEMAPTTSLRDCCGMSGQSNNATPPETQLTRTPLKLLDVHAAPVAVSHFSSRASMLSDWPALRRAPVVPLYLQQASLLI